MGYPQTFAEDPEGDHFAYPAHPEDSWPVAVEDYVDYPSVTASADTEISSPGTATADERDPTDSVDAHHVDIEVDFNHPQWTKPSRVRSCRRCKNSFASGNQLHAHLRKCEGTKKPATHPKPVMAKPTKEIIADMDEDVLVFVASVPDDEEIIESSAELVADTGLSFRSWHYATLCILFMLDSPASIVCVDSGCTMTLIDRVFFTDIFPTKEVKKTELPINVRGIGSARNSTDEYAVLDMYIPGEVSGRKVKAHIRREVHLVDNLKAKMLVGMDILAPEKMSLDLGSEQLFVRSCGDFVAPIQVTAKDNINVRRTVRNEKRIVIPPQSTTRIPVQLRTSAPLPDRDYMFEPSFPGVYAHLVDATLPFVCVKNDTNEAKVVPPKSHLGTVVEYDAEFCYTASPDDHVYAVSKADIKVNASDRGHEVKTQDGISLFGENEEISKLEKLITEFASIWEDNGSIVNLPQKDWMTVPLTSDWNSSSAPKLGQKMYPVGAADRQVIDKEFDKLHAQGRMAWSEVPTPFSFPVFVIWKTVNQTSDNGAPTKKALVVVDIRGLNKITTTDSYPLKLQSDVINALLGMRHISLMDGLAFFFQFPVQPTDWHKFTVISHRGLEFLKVAAMGFKNSPPFVQRTMDRALRPLQDFVKAYIDDLVAFSRTFDEHLQHLRELFILLVKLNVTISAKKTFLNYPSITLLGQRVDAFGLSTTEERLESLKNLNFPVDLEALEHYLGLTGWLRSKISYYAQRAEPLQREKTYLLKGTPADAKSGRKRKIFAKSTPIVRRPILSDSFDSLQEALSSPNFLVHVDHLRKTFVDVDASKRRGFGVQVYHVKGDPDGDDYLKSDIEPILFLSKTLNDAELRYWPTELEIACLVWTIRKIRHLIDNSPMTTIGCSFLLRKWGGK